MVTFEVMSGSTMRGKPVKNCNVGHNFAIKVNLEEM